ncbi:SDR family NAD(P)-dependent oxidoreductase [Ottowia thiooxydans]|uniref:SDR family NAD(P)-dependent oxidoreductase n=1 Tax=Ottowia thiooxydans TaxID=219182 RepID=UPI000404B071|nr:SDR family oxidoreductase [Ottowia thiooxydans]
MKKLLEEKTALVTGGGSGIGRATSLAFAREGASVCVVDRNIEAAQETVDEIRRQNGRALAVRADVAVEKDVKAMISEAADEFGHVDCYFNNAGIGTVESNSRGKSLAQLDLADWQRMLDVNLTGVFLCMKYELLAMGERGGSIVNNASIGGLQALRNAAAYTATKHGVIGLTKSAAIEYGDVNVRVNAVCPGHILTPLIMKSSNLNPDLPRMNPMNRLGTMEEIAELVVWLSSSRASFSNGAVFVADGGRLAAA